ncbi:hypothetical protein EX30DRAFT_373593 [Ascodesmis nigricans]|uniref:Uncharacterized protein n=1 Tax=Ascodesmis nigricans TaxID=341454 RepID=A0A4S2MNL2_9PEZI|nr:hypothetical protein EX30DRAFT_373593 [Ascodesmis nigricans]
MFRLRPAFLLLPLAVITITLLFLLPRYDTIPRFSTRPQFWSSRESTPAELDAFGSPECNPFFRAGVVAGIGKWQELRISGKKECSDSGKKLMESVIVEEKTIPEGEGKEKKEVKIRADMQRILELILPENGERRGNRTVVFYGDSIIRFLFSDLCEMLGGTVTAMEDVEGYWSAQDLQKRHECMVRLMIKDDGLDGEGKQEEVGVLRLLNVYVFGVADFGGSEEAEALTNNAQTTSDGENEDGQNIERRSDTNPDTPQEDPKLDSPKYLTTSEIDTTFLSHHPSVAFSSTRPPHTWRAESRILSASHAPDFHASSVDLIIMGTGMWDLPWYQRWVLAHTQPSTPPPTKLSTQPLLPPTQFLTLYESRLSTYLAAALTTHPKARKLAFLTLHEPQQYNMYPGFQLDGLPKEHWEKRVKWSATHRDRVAAFRRAQVQAVGRFAGELGKGEMEGVRKGVLKGREAEVEVEVWPYHEWVWGGGWRDDVHVSPEGNVVPEMAVLWELARMRVGEER